MYLKPQAIASIAIALGNNALMASICWASVKGGPDISQSNAGWESQTEGATVLLIAEHMIFSETDESYL